MVTSSLTSVMALAEQFRPDWNFIPGSVLNFGQESIQQLLMEYNHLIDDYFPLLAKIFLIFISAACQKQGQKWEWHWRNL
ncbi:hypothetical protein [Entomobacter blattae]|uniref:hypothetical protein n=1 Tax=Entomobacter blattae TaxID=2762277 RepID=UPI00193BF9A0|nr:hypothetical protein [Entomobacter blattae]